VSDKEPTVTHGVNPLSPNGDLSPLVQRLGRQADLNRDGHVSAPEFAQFLDQILHPAQAATPGLPGGVPPFRDRLVGFAPTGPADPAADLKTRVASLAQYLAPTSGHLGQIAAALGAPAGALGADGATLTLPGGEGALGVRDLGTGPVWQWMAQGTAVISGE
jgi:hypothetical protein